jgi:hypothetical protein
MEVEIIDESGRLIDKFRSQKTNESWQFGYHSGVAAGTYFIRVRLNKSNWISKRWINMK